MALLKEITNIQKPQWLQVNDTDTSWSVTGLNRINIVFGKNGCGKSSLLKNIASKRKIIMTVPMPESNMPIAQKCTFSKKLAQREVVSIRRMEISAQTLVTTQTSWHLVIWRTKTGSFVT